MTNKILRIKNDFKFALMQTFLKLNINHVTITRINFSADLRYVTIETVHVSNPHITKELNRSIFPIVKELKNHYHAKFFPKIIFARDAHSTRISRIDEIFEECAEDLEKTPTIEN
jgi:ribosome-binding factor A